MDHDDFQQLADRVRSGDPEALAKLVELYEPELRMVARHRLGPALRPYLDSLDLVQTVNKSFIVGLRQHKFDVSSRERLMGLVGTILRRKVARQWRKHRRQARDSQFKAYEGAELADVALALREPFEDPSESAMRREQWSLVLGRLDEMDRRLVQLRLEGHSTAAAARLLGVDADVMRVRLSRLRKRLSELGIPEIA